MSSSVAVIAAVAVLLIAFLGPLEANSGKGQSMSPNQLIEAIESVASNTTSMRSRTITRTGGGSILRADTVIISGNDSYQMIEIPPERKIIEFREIEGVRHTKIDDQWKLSSSELGWAKLLDLVQGPRTHSQLLYAVDLSALEDLSVDSVAGGYLLSGQMLIDLDLPALAGHFGEETYQAASVAIPSRMDFKATVNSRFELTRVTLVDGSSLDRLTIESYFNEHNTATLPE